MAKRETIRSIAKRNRVSESYLYRLRREGGVDIRNDSELSAALAGRQATPDAQRLLRARADRAEHDARRAATLADQAAGAVIPKEGLQAEATAKMPPACAWAWRRCQRPPSLM